MKRKLAALIASVAVAFGSVALAETIDTHKVFLPQDISGGRCPLTCQQVRRQRCYMAIPPRRACSRFGSRRRRAIASLRTPTRNPKPSRSSLAKLHWGWVRRLTASVEYLPAGSFASMPQGVVHYVFVDEDAVVQVNAIGPWGIDSCQCER